MSKRKVSAKELVLQGVNYRKEVVLPVFRWDGNKYIPVQEIPYSIRPLTDYETAEYNRLVIDGVEISSEAILEKLGIESPEELANLPPEREAEMNKALLSGIDLKQSLQRRMVSDAKYYAVSRGLSRHPLEAKGENWTLDEVKALPSNHPNILFIEIDLITGLTREVTGSAIGFPRGQTISESGSSTGS